MDVDGLTDDEVREHAMTAVKELDLGTPATCCVPIASARMSEQDAGSTAALFKALADPHRVRVVNLLATTETAVCVCDLVDLLGVSQPTVSFHMKKLVDAGLLEREQRGVWAYYSLREDAVHRLEGVFRFEGGER